MYNYSSLIKVQSDEKLASPNLGTLQRRAFSLCTDIFRYFLSDLQHLVKEPKRILKNSTRLHENSSF